MVRNQIDRWWNKVEQRHERSGIGSLIRPEDIYLRPEILQASLEAHMGLDLDQLGAVDVLDDDATLGEIELHDAAHAALSWLDSRADRAVEEPDGDGNAHRAGRAEPGRRGAAGDGAARVRGSLPAGQPRAAPGGDTMLEEASYLAGDLRVPVIVRSPLASGVVFADANLIVFGANDLSDEADVAARPVPKKSKTAAFVSDFRDLTVGDYVVHVEHGIAQYQGLKEIEQDGLSVEFMILEFAEGAKLYVPLTRLDLIQKYRSTDTGPAPVLNRLGSQQWTKTKARVRKAMQDMAGGAAEALRRAAHRAGHGVLDRTTSSSASLKTPSTYNETDDQIDGDSRHQVRHGIADADGPAAVRRRGLRQNRSGDARGVQGRAGRQAGCGADADDGAQLPAFRDVQAAVCAVPHQRRDDFALPHGEGAEGHRRARGDGQGRHSDRHAPAAFEGHQVPGSRPAGCGRGAALRRAPQGAAEADCARRSTCWP